MSIVTKAGYDSMTLLGPVFFGNPSNYCCFKFITAICTLCLEGMILKSLCLSSGFYILHVTSFMIFQSLRGDRRKSCLEMCTSTIMYFKLFVYSCVSVFSKKVSLIMDGGNYYIQI